MTNVRTITEVTISTTSTEPLRGIVEIGTAGSTTKFELSADIAHHICTGLEHFLTQKQHDIQRTTQRSP